MSFGCLDTIINNIRIDLKPELKLNKKNDDIISVKKNLYIKHINQSEPELTFIEYSSIVDRFLNQF